MSSKNVSLREDVYLALKEAKGDDESFSDVVERLLDSGDDHPLRRLEGMLYEGEAEAVRSRVEEFRSDLDEQMNRRT